MVSYNLDNMQSALKLSSLCERYKDAFSVDVTLGRQIVDGRSVLGVISFCGNVVGVNVSDPTVPEYQDFLKEMSELDTEDSESW